MSGGLPGVCFSPPPPARPPSRTGRDALRVGDRRRRAGRAASGWLDVPDGVDPGTRIPVTVVNGAKPGPVLALVAGTHGYEYTSILALQRLRARLDPARHAGGGHPRPHGQPARFYGRRIYYSPDGKNLNRVYPGEPDGTISERIAHAITREVIDPRTHLADMHCGDGNESLRPYAYWSSAATRARRGPQGAGPRLRPRPHRHRPRAAERPGPERSTPRTPPSCAASPRSRPSREAWASRTRRRWRAHEAGALSLIAHLGILDAPSVRVERPS